eukprot:366551-Chlamydomonas_euryale.AAC.12
MSAAAGLPKLMRILNAARLTHLEHVARMPDGSVVKQLFLLRDCWDWVEWLVGHAPRGGIGLLQRRVQWRSLCDSAQPVV